jgi:hypothetical protein
MLNMVQLHEISCSSGLVQDFLRFVELNFHVSNIRINLFLIFFSKLLSIYKEPLRDVFIKKPQNTFFWPEKKIVLQKLSFCSIEPILSVLRTHKVKKNQQNPSCFERFEFEPLRIYIHK